MKYCSKCGKELVEGAAACGACGAPIQQASPSVAKEQSGLGVAALVLSILGFLTGFLGIGLILDVIAILLAVLVLLKAKKKPVKTGLAIAGILVSGLSLVLCVMLMGGSLFENPRKDLLAEANSYYDSASYSSAIRTAEQLMEEYPDSREAKKAEDLIAKSKSAQAAELLEDMNAALEAQEWAKALSIGETLTEEHPDSEAAAEVDTLMEKAREGQQKDEIAALHKKLAASYEKEAWEDVLKQANEIILLSPDSPEAKEAQTMQEEAKAYYEAVMAAAYAYSDWFRTRENALLILKYFPDDEGAAALRASANDKIKERGQQALASFRTKRDDVQGITWYYPTNAPVYVNERCAIYPYIGKYDSDRTWMRWKTIYFGDNWLFFTKVIVNVDGTNFTLSYDRDEYSRDNKYGDVWEVLDMEVDETEETLLRLIAGAEKAVIRFQGDQYYYDMTVTQADKDGIYDVLYAFACM